MVTIAATGIWLKGWLEVLMHTGDWGGAFHPPNLAASQPYDRCRTFLAALRDERYRVTIADMRMAVKFIQAYLLDLDDRMQAGVATRRSRLTALVASDSRFEDQCHRVVPAEYELLNSWQLLTEFVSVLAAWAVRQSFSNEDVVAIGDISDLAGCHLQACEYATWAPELRNQIEAALRRADAILDLRFETPAPAPAPAPDPLREN
ncbi:MAG: hypothetical protein AAF916_08725 [Planctomycetota bacterium]